MVAVIAFSPVDDSEPRAIARALCQRDSDAIGRLVAQYHYRLLRYLVYLTSRREQAEDLIQETWMRVLERGAQYNGRSRFEPWLFSVARNLAIDDFRRKRETDSEDVLEHSPSDAPSPFAAAARSEDAAQVAAVMGALKPIYREALLLRFEEDLSLEEIAQVAGVPVSTVASRIQRGLAMLRARLEGGDHAA